MERHGPQLPFDRYDSDSDADCDAGAGYGSVVGRGSDCDAGAGDAVVLGLRPSRTAPAAHDGRTPTPYASYAPYDPARP
ncbi:hypothetical protein [Streptomyces sp. NPDC059247]|uniref:hypothetical protein n=1 Tax=Streptomyces sp. NPDC059247 TaxID=3346790 RepID=UPI00368CC8CC